MASIAFLLSFSLFINTQSSPNGPGPFATKVSPINKTLLLQMVNNVRKKGCRCGDTYYPPAPTISWNNQLEQAALVHSNDMYANNYFAHAAQDGTKAGDRLEDIGYHWHTYGENIAQGYRNEQEVVTGWIHSPGHCKNIMNKAFKEMGVSRVGDYWTQVFATK